MSFIRSKKISIGLFAALATVSWYGGMSTSDNATLRLAGPAASTQLPLSWQVQGDSHASSAMAFANLAMPLQMLQAPIFSVPLQSRLTHTFRLPPPHPSVLTAPADAGNILLPEALPPSAMLVAADHYSSAEAPTSVPVARAKTGQQQHLDLLRMLAAYYLLNR